MQNISTFSNGNYEAQIAKTYDNLYTVTYMINGKVIKKTNHQTLELAENIAEDFILEGGGPNPIYLND